MDALQVWRFCSPENLQGLGLVVFGWEFLGIGLSCFVWRDQIGLQSVAAFFGFLFYLKNLYLIHVDRFNEPGSGGSPGWAGFRA